MRTPGRLAILGAGTMGTGIAEIAHQRGFTVRLHDVDEHALQNAPAGVETTPRLPEAVREAPIVLEAIPEDLGLKRTVLEDAQAHAPDDAVIASNTSALRITDLQRGLPSPSHIVGMHFFHPVDRMDLVEIIPGDATLPETIQAAETTSQQLGKPHVTLDRDPPGFVTTRLVLALGLSALRARDAGMASRDAIDAAMHQEGFPMGPFQVMDHSGLDVTLQAASYLARELDPAYEPPDTLKAMVEEGRMGAKSGRGFYEWTQGVPRPDAGGKDSFPASALRAVVANEAALLLDAGVADADRIDQATRGGLGFPNGPIAWAREATLERVLELLDDLREASGDPLAEPSPALRDALGTS